MQHICVFSGLRARVLCVVECVVFVGKGWWAHCVGIFLYVCVYTIATTCVVMSVHINRWYNIVVSLVGHCLFSVV